MLTPTLKTPRPLRPACRHHPRRPLQPLRSTATWANTLITQSYFIGKGITLFTFFYCSLNAIAYHEARKNKELEENSSDDDN